MSGHIYIPEVKNKDLHPINKDKGLANNWTLPTKPGLITRI